MPSPNKSDINIHVDKEVKEALEKYSDALLVSVSWLCNRALKQFLDDLPPVEEVVITFGPKTKKPPLREINKE